jgi:hypothetical protein
MMDRMRGNHDWELKHLGAQKELPLLQMVLQNWKVP